MNRYFIYIPLALLIFVTVSFTAVKFYRNAQFESQNIKKTETTQANFSPKTEPVKSYSIKESEQTFFQIDSKQQVPEIPFCRDGKILPVWKQLIKEKNFKDWEVNSRESLDCAEMLELKKIDLNNDGQKEIILRGQNFNLCSAVGNCAFWIYGKNGGKYKRLLYSTDYRDISEIGEQIQESKTKGYSDILLKGHMTAADTTHEVYKFDGKKYKQTKCSVKTPVSGTSDNPKWQFISCKEFFKRWETVR